MKDQNIAIVGLNHAGETFLNEMVRLKPRGVNVVGVCADSDEPGLQTARKEGIECLSLQELVDLGERVDVIFDMSGNRQVRANLRKTLFSSQNQHTIIAPENVARVMWAMIGGDDLPGEMENAGY